jgi:hypothetical protein
LSVQIPINGIRLGPGLVWAGQNAPPAHPFFSVSQILSAQCINLVCAGLHRRKRGNVFSGCVESGYREVIVRLAREDPTVLPPANVTQVFVYPHRKRLAVPLVLLEMLDVAGVPFYHLVTSPAVICVVIDTRDQDRMITLLEDTFALPASHTPYIQEIDQDISALLKKYPETRSAYVEEKIRTYGIQLIQGLFVVQLQTIRDRFSRIADTEFHLMSVMPNPGRPEQDADDVIVVSDGSLAGEDTAARQSVDLITFHGPHFGDRYRILQTALDCLETEQIPLRVAACAGASISLVFPAGTGHAAKIALEKGFDAP